MTSLTDTHQAREPGTIEAVAPATHRSLAVPLLLGGILLLGLVLRLYCLDCRSFWGDEINSLDGASIGIPAIFNGRFGWISNQTPLHYLIVWLTTLPVDPTTSGILVRLPSALVGALTPLVVYALGREMFGRPQGLLAALMVALSAVHLNHSQELRLYAMMVFLSVLSVYALLAAQRTARLLWWVVFVLATLLDIANAYIVVTLFMPTYGIYLAWVLWKSWSMRREARRHFSYALGSMLVVAAGYLAAVLDMLSAPRMAPGSGGFSLQSAFSSIIELNIWFTRFGLDSGLERVIQLLLLVFALLGLYVAFRDYRRVADSALLCALFVVVPAVLLYVFSTTSVVFQRYALFSMPFYFLLISNGAFGLPKILPGTAQSRARGPQIVTGAMVGLLLLVFAVGAYNYFSPNGHLSLTYRPDFRGVAHYLSKQVTTQDTIVFLDDPGLGYTISNYYWKSNPPTAAYDARDPRVFMRAATGDIYWVVSFEDLSVLPRIAAQNQGWVSVQQFERVVVLREGHPASGILGSMDRMVSKLEAIKPYYQPVVTLRGGVEQAQGDIDKAAATYERAGTYFPVGDDYLRTAEGFAARGDNVKAWREADISKFWQPGRTQVHEWYAKALMADGHAAESRGESRLAQVLSGTTAR